MRETVKKFVKIARVPNYMFAHVTVREHVIRHASYFNELFNGFPHSFVP